MNVEETATVNPRQNAEAHIQQYLASDGAEVDHPAADRLILLYTTGRRTGETRRTPLAAFDHGDSLVVIASNAGRPTLPSWYLNLSADPSAWVRRKADLYRAVSSDLEGDERQAFWERLVALSPVFAEFQERSGRLLPLVKLTPSD